MIRRDWLRRVALAGVIGSTLGVTGCGGAESAEITGKVMHNGQPLQAGKVTFYDPERPGRNVIGDIKADGTYRVFACPTGQVKVTVQPLPPPSDKGQPQLADGEGHKGVSEAAGRLRRGRRHRGCRRSVRNTATRPRPTSSAQSTAEHRRSTST